MKDNSKKGAALVMVACVSAFLAAFSLAMVYTSGLLLSRANRRLEQERSYQAAQSFAKVLDFELKKYNEVENALTAAPDDSFYRYVYKFLEGAYGEYDPDHPDETIFHYTSSNDTTGTEEYGKIRVVLYKETSREDDDSLTGEIMREDNNPQEIFNMTFQRYIFTVEVTATLNDISYSYSTEYSQSAAYDVSFSCNGVGITWKDNHWCRTGTDQEYIIGENEKVRYEFDNKKITRCTFDHIFAEEGGH